MPTRWSKIRLRPALAGFLALALTALTPVVAFAQDGYISLRDGNEVLVFDPTDPTNTLNRIVFGDKTNGLAVSPDGTKVYVIEGSAVKVLRLIDNGVLDGSFSVSLAGGVHEQVAVSPDGTTVYVTNAGNNSKVHIVDVATQGLTNENLVQGSGAWGVAMAATASGPRAYVSLSGTNQASVDANTVKVFDVSTGSIIATIPVGTVPQGVAASPLGDFVYVANFSDDSVSKIDTATNTVVATIPVGDGPQELTASADGSLVYVTLRNLGSVDVIDTSTNAVDSTVVLGNSGDALHGISYSADGAFVVVAHFGSDKISVINPATGNTFVTTGPPTVLDSPRYVAFAPLAPVLPDDPPAFTLPLCDTDIDALLGQEVAVDVSVTDDNGAIVTLSEAPVTGGALDAPFPATPGTPVTNTFRWTPTAANPAGNYVLTFTADDTFNAPVACQLTIVVPAPPDQPPTLVSPACGQTLTPALGDTVTFTIDGADDNGATLSVSGLPAGATTSPELPQNGSATSSQFSWTPTGDDHGTHTVTFTVDDGVNPPVSCTVTIEVPEPDEEAAFAAFFLRVAKVSTRGRYADFFWFNGAFKVDLESGDDISPADEDITIAIEKDQWVLPAGSLQSRWRGRLFMFRGVVDGTKLFVRITRSGWPGSGRYNINVSGFKGELHADNPLEMCVTIGDDAGCAAKKGWIR